MRTFVIFFLGLPTCFGASSVRVLGVTNTQAVIQVVLDDSTSCTIEVSETPLTYVPLVHDVDASLFPGANDCFRAGSLISGNSVTMVIGSRWADWDSAGTNTYSHALHAAAMHYYRITTTTSVTTGSFTTANISLGKTWFDTLPMDPVRLPHYRWPMFTSLTDQTESVIDPLTGALIRRISMPRIAILDKTGNTNTFAYALGSWVNPANALHATILSGQYATFTGTGSGTQPWLLLAMSNPSWNIGITPNDWSNGSIATDWFWAQAQGHISNAACAGDDCKIQVCLTIDGNSCWSRIQETALTGADSAVTVGSQTDMSPWRQPYSEYLPQPYTGTTTTTVSINATGLITYSSGDLFRPHWTNGSWVQIQSGSNPWCQVNRVLSNGNQLQLQSAACAANGGVTLPATVTVFGANFGLLIRKKTVTADAISIGATNWKWGASAGLGFVATGSFQLCGSSLVNGGYYCADKSPGGAWYVFWINPTTGAANLLGNIYAPAKSSGSDDQWTAGSTTADSFIIDQDSNFYALKNDSAGKTIILRAYTQVTAQATVYTPISAMGTSCTPGATGTYQITCTFNGVSNGITWTDITPSSLGADLKAQLVAFTAGEPDQFRPMVFPTCTLSEASGSKLKGYCWGATQDTLTWLWRMEVGDGNPAHAGTLQGPHIDAAQSSYTYFPARFSRLHALFPTGEPNYFLEALSHSTNSWKATLADTSLAACTPGGTRTLTITTDISDPNVNLPGLTPGDYIALNNSAASWNQNSAEIDQITARADNTITTVCGVGGSQTTTIAGPATLYAWGVSGDLVPEMVALSGFQITKPYWNADADPHGRNIGYSATGSNPAGYGPSLTVGKDAANDNAHQFYRAGMFVSFGGGSFYCLVNKNNNCYQSALGTVPAFLSTTVPNYVTHTEQSSNGAFSGAASNSGSVYESHVSPSGVNAKPEQRSLFLDIRPVAFQNGYSQGNFTLVPGTNQVWKLVCTVAGATNPDDLSGNCALNRKRLPTLLMAGRWGGVDISGPSALLNDIAADAYKYGIVRVAGEVRPGSVPGEIYVNLPNMTGAGGVLGSCPPISGTLMDIGTAYKNTICVSNNGMFGMAMAQVQGGIQDPYGTQSRAITARLSHYATDDPYANARLLPDNSWALFRTLWVNDAYSSLLMVQMPPTATTDSMQRAEFVPFPVCASSVPAGTDNVTVEFGYEENRGGNFTAAVPPCTSRQETCLAYSGIQQRFVPFEYASSDLSPNGNKWNGQGVACASSCTVNVPGISQRVMFYRIRYQQGSTVLAAGPMQVTAVP